MDLYLLSSIYKSKESISKFLGDKDIILTLKKCPIIYKIYGGKVTNYLKKVHPDIIQFLENDNFISTLCFYQGTINNENGSKNIGILCTLFSSNDYCGYYKKENVFSLENDIIMPFFKVLPKDIIYNECKHKNCGKRGKIWCNRCYRRLYENFEYDIKYLLYKKIHISKIPLNCIFSILIYKPEIRNLSLNSIDNSLDDINHIEKLKRKKEILHRKLERLNLFIKNYDKKYDVNDSLNLTINSKSIKKYFINNYCFKYWILNHFFPKDLINIILQ
jgi:hypothetical protein